MTTTLTFWGTRGSIPTPGPATTRYGGNTACVAIHHGDDRLLVLDAGTGIRVLGQDLIRRVRPPTRVDIVLSHTHWDHIQGLPFFEPLHHPHYQVGIYGARQGGVRLEEILNRQMAPVVFPIPMQRLAADVAITEVSEGAFTVDPFRVEALRLRHPGTTLGYKLTPPNGGGVLAYVTDNELGQGGDYDVPADWRDRLVTFLTGVDVLIHDGMFSEESLRTRYGWGHSTPRQAVELSVEAGVPRLVLFHHEPGNSDDAIDQLLADARALARTAGPGLEVEAAHEGMTLTL